MKIHDIEKRLLLSLCPSGYHQRQKKKQKTCLKYCVFSTILSSKKMFWLVDKFKSVNSLNKLNKTHLPPMESSIIILNSFNGNFYFSNPARNNNPVRILVMQYKTLHLSLPLRMRRVTVTMKMSLWTKTKLNILFLRLSVQIMFKLHSSWNVQANVQVT